MINKVTSSAPTKGGRVFKTACSTLNFKILIHPTVLVISAIVNQVSSNGTFSRSDAPEVSSCIIIDSSYY